MKNLGHKNEHDFVNALNGKKVCELDFLLQELVLFLFPSVKYNSVVYCYKNVEYEKGDICIKVGYRVKYISIKMGHKNSVHCESIKKFTKFLESLNISSSTINEILRYQYADGTIDGTGNYRQTTAEYKQTNFDSIQKINKEINNSEVLKESVNRFIIQGTQGHTHKVDLLIYGNPNDFFYLTPKEIYDYIQSKKDVDSSAIHFSCLTFQPLSRVLDYNEKMEYMRNWIQIKWYNLEDNIIEIMNQRL